MPADQTGGEDRGKEFLGRFSQRSENRDAASSLAARDAQYDAVLEWGIPDHAALQRLTGIQCPTLILQGDNDLRITLPRQSATMPRAGPGPVGVPFRHKLAALWVTRASGAESWFPGTARRRPPRFGFDRAAG